MSTESNNTHHHHHHHHHKDSTTRYREKMARDQKLRKMMPKILWAIGCGIAAIVTGALAFAYIFDK